MALASRRAARSATDDIYFEPTDLSDAGFIKQDLTSEDGFTPETLEDRLRKSWIGAYRGTQDGLPAEKGFSIQIGSELFRLSGASIMSDAPSYFSKFFEAQLSDTSNVNGSVRTLFIDRDPETFRDIARHLQGYYVYPKDGQHYVRLFADAQFYSLPRLNKQLFESEIYISIGDTDFKIPKDIFSAPDNSPNFFSMGFATFFASPDGPFPGLNREGLIRPPPIEAPRVQGRSASIFADLLQLLRGYPLEIRSADHRAALLRDCRYYQFKGLEQKLILHEITYIAESKTSEILLRIADLRQSGLSMALDPSGRHDPGHIYALVEYARPSADQVPHRLVVEIHDDNTTLDFSTHFATFTGQMKNRMASLIQVIYKIFTSLPGWPPSLTADYRVDGCLFDIDSDCDITLDGSPFDASALPRPSHASVLDITEDDFHSKKRKLSVLPGTGKGHLDDTWTVRRGQWRIGVKSVDSRASGYTQSMIVSLDAVKLDAVSGQKGRNKTRGFLAQ